MLIAAESNKYCGYGIDPSNNAIQQGNKQYSNLHLETGTADNLPYENGFFKVVIFGFCLYLVDRDLLMRTIAEADRVLGDKGFIIITDFDSIMPHKRKYHHLPDREIYSYKMDYAQLFFGCPHYALVEKISYSHQSEFFCKDMSERVATTILYKDVGIYSLCQR
ncbi:MAG: hypothetical protein COC15_03440 [Legionellales bacterium]|nr:MAG: hypothetical protein COC15_03440 [Legionellales bacterium]